jgi:hypothetical protein
MCIDTHWKVYGIYDAGPFYLTPIERAYKAKVELKKDELAVEWAGSKQAFRSTPEHEKEQERILCVSEKMFG